MGAATETPGSLVADQLAALLTRIPPSWVAASREVLAGRAAAPSERAAWGALLRALVWKQTLGDLCVPVLGLTVKLGTQLQLAGAVADLDRKHLAYIADAFSAVAAPPEALSDLRQTLRRLWKLRWESAHKEPLWRLALHGIAGFPLAADQVARASRAGTTLVLRCPCGAAMSGPDGCWVRRHLFWDCFVARALRETMGAAMGTR